MQQVKRAYVNKLAASGSPNRFRNAARTRFTGEAFMSTPIQDPTSGSRHRTHHALAELLGLRSGTELHIDNGVPQLVEAALRQGEAVIAANGALAVKTGERTGRSPKDRFIIDHPSYSSQIDWGPINQAFESEAFEELWGRVVDHLARSDKLFVSHLQAGADPEHRQSLRVITEFAWHNLFARQLFVRNRALEDRAAEVDWTILNAPTFVCQPARDKTHSNGAVILDFAGRRILLAGMRYAGEMKKAVFTTLNYLLPADGILPMHCAANVGEDGDVALFFGLSGTGKTTLSADPDRFLIGDDEHGWNSHGIFNFEGGCYAKCINLSPEREPVIWDAIRFGSVMENVVIDPRHRTPDYEDDAITQNTRVAYPRDFIEKRVPGNAAGHPDAVIFLTCDLYGVLPPVSMLTKEQAAYHFLSGYTALVGSTEVGSTEGLKPNFSACFGAPFFPRPPAEYARLLMDKVERHNAPVYLVNTGWTGGAYGQGGQRFSIATTRAIVHAILRGEVRETEHRTLDVFDLRIPRRLHGLDSRVLNPRDTWSDKGAYDRILRELAGMFQKNFEKFDASADIAAAGPRA
jgi:phosphoenolpyruvate carboxykinase (ATP)